MAALYHEQLRVAMRERGWSQAKLAKHLLVSSAAVNHWVRGTKPVPEERQAEIERLLGWEPEGRVSTHRLVEQLQGAGTPMAFLLLQAVPEPLVSKRTRRYPVANTQEAAEWALRCWALWLKVEEAHLLGVALGQEYLTWHQVRRVADAGVGLTYLGQHVGVEVPEHKRCAEWMEQAPLFLRWVEVLDYVERGKVEAPRWESLPVEDSQAAVAQMLEEMDVANHADAIYHMWQEMLDEQGAQAHE